MATNNSTSLYSFNSNVKVSPNNFTTLYNSNPGTIVSANVADRNFTTLYTQQTATAATKPYGNSNVEAFLNIGFDSGGNQVQNIHMANSLYVGGNSYLGNVGNVYIDGGSLNYVLSTDGAGNLNWISQTTGNNVAEYIHFDVTSDGNNQQFSNDGLNVYASANTMNLFKNGVNIQPFYYEKASANTVQVNIDLMTGDSIDILASTTGGIIGGANTDVQFNFEGSFAGTNNFTYDPSTNMLNVGDLTLTNGYANTILWLDTNNKVSYAAGLDITNLSWNLDPAHNYYAGTIGNNTTIGLWFTSVTQATDFFNYNPPAIILNDNYNTGNIWYAPLDTAAISWSYGTLVPYVQVSTVYGVVVQGTASGATSVALAYSVIIPTSLDANISNVHISGGTSGQVLSTDGAGNLLWATGGGGGGGSGTPVGGFNAIQVVDPTDVANFYGTQNFTYKSELGPAGIYDTTHVHLNTDTDVPTSTLDSSVISFDADTNTGNGYGQINAGQLKFETPAFIVNASSEVHHISSGFQISSINPSATTSVIVMAGNIGFNEGWYAGALGHVSLGNISNVRISGGTSGQVLSTNGSNNLSWTSNIANANYAAYAGNVTIATQGNITSVGSLVGLTVSNATGIVDFVTTANVSLGNVSNLHISGGTLDYVLKTDGAGNLSWVAQSGAGGTPGGSNTYLQFNNAGSFGGSSTLTFDNTSNTLTSTGNIIIQRAYEKYVTVASGTTGTINFDVLDQSILYYTVDSSANFTLNIRGNSTTSLNTILPINDTVTVAFLNTVGATAYVINSFTIDSTSVTPQYVGGNAPTSGTRLTSATQSYTYTIMKSAANTYTVLGSLVEYK